MQNDNETSITKAPSSIQGTGVDLDPLMEFASGLGLTAVEMVAPEPVQDAAKTLIRLVQAGVRGKFLGEISSVMKEIKEKGRLIELKTSDIAQDATTELIDFIDSSKTSDEERFKAAKKLFFYGLLVDTDEYDRVHAKQFLKITKGLEGTDILILKGCYELAKQYDPTKGNYPTDADGWAKSVADKSGLKFKGLILSRENRLMESSLIGKRTHSDQSGISFSDKARLSDLGFGYCEFLEKSETALEGIV